MRVVRNGVFETNSSSMHSLAISAARYYIFPGGRTYLIVPKEYGWYAPNLTDPEEKINYLLSLIASNEGVNWAVNEEGAKITEEEFLDLPDVCKVIEAVEKHGSKILYKKGHDGFGGVDHQSVCSLDNFLNGIDLEDFIFNTKYEVIVDNDNH